MSRRDGQELPSPDRPPLRPTPEQAVVARLLGRPQWLRSRAELQKRRIKEDGQTLHAWRLAQLGDWRRDRPVYAFVRPNIDTFSGSSLVISTTDGFRTLAKANTAGEVRGRFGLGRRQPPLANNRVERKEVGPDPRLSRRGRPVVSPKPTGPVRPLARLSRERPRRKPRIKPGVAASTAGSLCVSGGWPSACYSGDGLAQSRPSD